MKKHIALLTALLILTFAAAGCGPAAQPSQAESAAQSGPPPSAESSVPAPENADVDPAVWETVSGSFVREESSQYNNAVLQMKYLSNSCVMFEFRLMEGSEAEDYADTIVLPFVLLVDDNGVGHYESLPQSENPFAIDFVLSADGQQVTVTHEGALSISPDGVYTFIDSGLEVSEVSATAILDHLPTAATSLNHNNGAYTLQYPEALVADWFYPVDATFDDTGAVLAKFIVAKDLSAVYRMDDDIEPVLIFGSAQPMLDARIMIAPNDAPSEAEDSSSQPEGAEAEAEGFGAELPLAWVELENGVFFAPGESNRLTVILPWELPYTLTAQSADLSVATVDDNGVVTAVAAGETTISGVLTVDDGEMLFKIAITVEEDAAQVEMP